MPRIIATIIIRNGFGYFSLASNVIKHFFISIIKIFDVVDKHKIKPSKSTTGLILEKQQCSSH